MSYSHQGIIGSSSVGGEWELVERWVPTSASTSYTFTGLNGNRDIRYKVVSRLLNGSVGNTSLISFYINNDSGNNYKQMSQDYAGGSINGGIGTVNNMVLGYFASDSILDNCEVFLDAKSNAYRYYKQYNFRITNSTPQYLTNTNGYWWNNTDNITSLVLQSSTASSIGVGSYVELWRLKQNNQISSGQWNLVERWEPTVATTSYTFTGLNGNRDRRYKVIATAKTNSQNGAWFLQVNNDTNASNYHGGRAFATVGITNVAGLYMSYHEAISLCDMNLEMNAKSGVFRTSTTQSTRAIYADASDWSVDIPTAIWKNTTDNITSLTFSSTISNAISVGSSIELWKLNQ